MAGHTRPLDACRSSTLAVVGTVTANSVPAFGPEFGGGLLGSVEMKPTEVGDAADDREVPEVGLEAVLGSGRECDRRERPVERDVRLVAVAGREPDVACEARIGRTFAPDA